MSNRFPPLNPPEPLAMKRLRAARPGPRLWHVRLPIGELLVIAAFGLVLLMA